MEKFKKGNDKKRQIVNKLTSEILLHNNSFSIFQQEDGLDCFALEQIRSDARKQGLKLVFIPNRIFRVALSQHGFESENLNTLLTHNNFLVFSKDPIHSTTLSNYIKDKKLKNKVQIKALFLKYQLIEAKEQIAFFMKIGSEKGLKVMMIQLFKRNIIRFVRILKAHCQ